MAVSSSSTSESEQSKNEAELNLPNADHSHVLVDPMNPGDVQHINLWCHGGNCNDMVILKTTMTLTVLLTIRMTMMTILI